MVAPYRHVARLDDLDDGELVELMTLTRRCVRALEEGFGPDGFNIGVNQGKTAGAGIADHLRWWSPDVPPSSFPGAFQDANAVDRLRNPACG